MPSKPLLLAAVAPLALAAPAPAQTGHAGHSMPTTPAAEPAARDPHAGHATGTPTPAQAAAPASSDPHAGHDMSSTRQTQATDTHAGHNMQPEQPAPATADPHAGHTMPPRESPDASPSVEQLGTNLPAGTGTPPPVPADKAADRFYRPSEMEDGRHHLQHMHGGQNFYQVMFDLAEYQIRDGDDGFNWDVEAWYGGDIHRLWLRSEGEGDFKRGVERAEIQALYSRAIGPYFNLQGGVRYDFRPNPSRVYAALGVEGLAPSFFELEGFVFLSDKGDVLLRAGGAYDQRITQRLILQPRAELNFAFQDMPDIEVGSGLSEAELGLRLRYDITREFSPYVGVEYEESFGRTKDLRRVAGEKGQHWNLVIGVRTWF
jgi:copper resistance protein B